MRVLGGGRYSKDIAKSPEEIVLDRLDQQRQQAIELATEILERPIRRGRRRKRRSLAKTICTPAQKIAVLGLFSREALEAAVDVVTQVVQRGVQAKAPSEQAERNYLTAAKTILEYELGKPRQQVELKGDGIKQTVTVIVPSGLNPEVYGNGSNSSGK